MAQTVYLDRLDDPGAKTVQTMGLQPGPVGGDNWSVVAELPTARLQAATHYAFWITGKIGNVRLSGATPVSGLLQLCLGDAAGTRSPLQLVEIGAADALGANEGVPFAFLLIFAASPAVSDPVWGPVWPNTANLQLHGRTYWRNDTPAYAVQFDVTDLQWVWADLDAIPAADQLVTVTTTPVALGSSLTNCASSLNTPGAAGEVWAHWFAVHFAPGAGAVPAFQVGYATGGGLAGFTARHGGAGRFGVGHRGTAVHGVQHHLGTFWVEPQVGATYLPAVRGRDVVVGAQATEFRRFACLSIRLDNLPDVHYASSTLESNMTDELATALFVGSRRFPLELVGTSRSVNPWVFATGTPDLVLAQRRAFGLWVNTDDYTLLAFQVLHESTQGPAEGVPCYASAAQGLGPTSPGVQYQSRWLEHAFGGVHHHVRDVYFLTFGPVRDPDNVPPTDPGVADPVAIDPGFEALDAGSLSPLPIAPDVATGETINWRRESLEGATGHRRTWGVFVKPRRTFSLSWSPLSTAQRDTLLAFLAANLAFRLTPLRETAIAVVPVREVTFAQDSAQTWRVDLEVAELIYTGP